jgi:hypothetical protein
MTWSEKSLQTHDYQETGVACAPGCLILADAAGIRRRAQRFGIKRDDLTRLIRATNGLCMICRLCHASVVEHCHNLGIVRGIVCRWCNNRVAFLEGAYADKPPVYRRGMLCPCIDGLNMMPEIGALEMATYLFIDHAVDIAVQDRGISLAKLSASPYPEECTRGRRPGTAR